MTDAYSINGFLADCLVTSLNKKQVNSSHSPISAMFGFFVISADANQAL
jgi:hypothetical protein